MGLGSTTGFADHNHQGGLEAITQVVIEPAHASGVDVVEEVERQALTVFLQGADHQQRAQA